ncbi:PucR family transcriptional regulator [Mesobacillus zeae]|uniref:PucR C-terminal helix-turn-helix domain-containing protein n=1 Tax=Mesobacillus zeae TaxID=1917180 RepID=A0A398BAC5_9BACI|nr:helix-turn-helix domain-containing protein [Mesobacillus zeae]RID84646.1 hypothetical protein D1970_12210 [Mesobacillus zeae]
MLKQLQNYFQNTLISNDLPYPRPTDFFWFREHGKIEWIGIPKRELQQGQLDLLKGLFEMAEPENMSILSGKAKEWRDYLLLDGPLPVEPAESVRFIQFQTSGAITGSGEFSEALQEFFLGSTIIWIDPRNGIIAETGKAPLYDEDEIFSIARTLESDFYIKTFFYIGKTRHAYLPLKELFMQEREMFAESLTLIPGERVFMLEKIIPSSIAAHLPQNLNSLIKADIAPVLEEDPELLDTLLVFLKCGSNVSLAAKQLYIHRNTLQYRLEKFSERTGINLKDFHSSITVYLACLHGFRSN